MTLTLSIQGLERPLSCPALGGQSIRQALSEHLGIHLGRCGGYGACGTCVVQVDPTKVSPVNDIENAYPYLDPGERLACQTLLVPPTQASDEPIIVSIL
jgi:ferredoxin